MPRTKPVRKNAPSKIPPQREPLVPLNDKQKTYIKSVLSEDAVIGAGPAGTGKTYIPTVLAADAFMDGKINRIVITRPVIGAGGEELGYFPGDMEMKFGHWVIPVMEALDRRMGKARRQFAMKEGQIEIAPLSTMRGRTFDDAFVLLDEAQNTSYDQIKMFLTRAGQRSKIVVTGDLAQTDVYKKNGLASILHIIETQRLPVPVVQFSRRDVVRSESCAMWVQAFEDYENA